MGDLDLPFESLPIDTGSSSGLVTYLPGPGTPSHEALALLASWAASGHESALSTDALGRD